MILGIAFGILIFWVLFSLYMLLAHGEGLPLIMLVLAGIAAVIVAELVGKP